MSKAGTIKLADDVIDVLRRSTRDGNTLRLPPSQLERTLYVKVNKAIECLGGKWNKSAKGHIFTGHGIRELDGVLDAGEVVDEAKLYLKLYQFYPTPHEIVDRLLGWADIREHDLVLEPSAGDGAIVNRIPYKSRIHVCEIQGLEFRRAHAANFDGTHFVCSDFLKYSPGPIYDRIVANPPFTKSQDMMHVGHMLELVKVGGRVVSVVAGGFKFRDDLKTNALRVLLDAEFDWHVHDLAANAFKESGTGVNTCVIVATRKAAQP